MLTFADFGKANPNQLGYLAHKPGGNEHARWVRTYGDVERYADHNTDRRRVQESKTPIGAGRRPAPPPLHGSNVGPRLPSTCLM